MLWWLKKFCKGDKSLEDEEHSGWPLEVDDDQLRALLKLMLLKHHKRLPKNSASTILWSFDIWGKLERWKSLISRCLIKWTAHKSKKSLFWSVVFSYSVLQQWTISWLDCDMQWKMDFYNNWQWPSQWLDLEEAPKHFPKPNLHQKRSWSLFGGLLLVWSTTAFWILVKPLHLRSMLSKSMRCTENCNACSQHWSTERAQFFSMTMPNCTSHNQCFKSWTNWAMKFCLICHIHLTSHQLTTTSSSISTTFCRENASTTSRRQKMLSKSLSNPEAQIFML